mgnify:CR=1 FL=1
MKPQGEDMPDFDRLRETVEEMKAERDGAIVDDLIPKIEESYRTDFLSVWQEMDKEEQGKFLDQFADEVNAYRERRQSTARFPLAESDAEFGTGISDLVDKYVSIVAEREAWAMVKGNEGE